MTTKTHTLVTSLHIAPTEGEQLSGQSKAEDGLRDKGHWQICPRGEEEQHLRMCQCDRGWSEKHWGRENGR